MQKHCDASLIAWCTAWQLETLETTQVKTVEQETKETKAEEQIPQVSLPSHAPQSNHPEPSPAPTHASHLRGTCVAVRTARAGRHQVQASQLR